MRSAVDQALEIRMRPPFGLANHQVIDAQCRGILEREQAEAKEKLLEQLEVGQVREGTVRNIRDFGAFANQFEL